MVYRVVKCRKVKICNIHIPAAEICSYLRGVGAITILPFQIKETRTLASVEMLKDLISVTLVGASVDRLRTTLATA